MLGEADQLSLLSRGFSVAASSSYAQGSVLDGVGEGAQTTPQYRAALLSEHLAHHRFYRGTAPIQPAYHHLHLPAGRGIRPGLQQGVNPSPVVLGKSGIHMKTAPRTTDRRTRVGSSISTSWPGGIAAPNRFPPGSGVCPDGTGRHRSARVCTRVVNTGLRLRSAAPRARLLGSVRPTAPSSLSRPPSRWRRGPCPPGSAGPLRSGPTRRGSWRVRP